MGIWLDSKMTFSPHIDDIINRSYRSLGFVMRTCKPFTHIDSLKIVYYAYVRSVLEYASAIWSPNYAIHVDRIEKIQKKFVNHLKYKFKLDKSAYADTCRELEILTLRERRLVLDMGLLFDVLRGRLDCPELLEQISFKVPTRRTRHTQLFAVPSHKTNYGMNAVMSRIVKEYNLHFSEVDPFIGGKGVFMNGAKDILFSQ